MPLPKEPPVTVCGTCVSLRQSTIVPRVTLITFGLKKKTPLLVVEMTTTTVGGGGGVGVGRGVGDGVGRGVGVGVGLKTCVGVGVGVEAGIVVAVGVVPPVEVVAVGLVPLVVGEEVTGVLVVPLVGLFTMAVGVVPEFVVGVLLPPQAATRVSKPNNKRQSQAPGCEYGTWRFCGIVFSLYIPLGWLSGIAPRFHLLGHTG